MILKKIERVDDRFILTFSAYFFITFEVKCRRNCDEFLGKKVLKIEDVEGFPYESLPPQGYCDFIFENGKISAMLSETTYNTMKKFL